MRLAIVELLVRRPTSVQDIAAHLPISRPAVSRHLKVLKQADLVDDRSDGTRRVYYVRPEGLSGLREYLERLWSVARRRFALVAENTRPGARRG